jgi:hypothetical protein
VIIGQPHGVEVPLSPLRTQAREGQADRGQRNGQIVQLPDHRNHTGHEIDR